ncbi:MAG: O-antigen ligase family protein [Gemmatimonadota bacterium]
MTLTLLGLIAAAAVFVVAALQFARRPLILVYLLLFVHFLSAARLPVPRLAMGLGLADLISLLALGVAVLRMPRGPTGLQWAIVGALGLMVYGTLSGLLRFGGGAMLGFRAELYFLVPALFVSTLNPRELPVVVRSIVYFGMALVVVAMARWIGVLPYQSELVEAYLVQRVIPGNAALWVAMATVAGLLAVFQRSGDRVIRLPWPVLVSGLLVVLLTQHRTVWIAALVMVAAVFVATSHRPLLKAGMVLGAGVMILLVEGLGLGRGSDVADSLALAATDIGTWKWRLERWAQVWQVHADRGPFAVILGSGYGYGWLTGAVGVWEVSPHNGYLQIAVRLGLVGAVLVYFPYLQTLRQLWKSPRAFEHLLWFWTAGVLVYYIPYSGDILTGILLGMALMIVTSLRPPPARIEGSESARSPIRRPRDFELSQTI